VYSGPLTASPEESLELASSEREGVPEAPEWLGTIRPATLLRNATGIGGAPTENDLPGRPKQGDMPGAAADQGSQRPEIMELCSPPALQNPLAQYLQKLLGMGRTPSSEGGGGDELPVGGHRRGRVGPDAKPLEEGVEVSIDLEGPPIGHLYPEWNWQKQ